MIRCWHKSNKWVCSPLKTVLGRTGGRYQYYCTTYKTHTMTTDHGGTGHPGEDRELNSYIEDTKDIDIGSNNDNESENSSDSMVAFREVEANGHLSDPLPNSQTDLKLLTREISHLQQCVEAGDGQPTEGLDCIDHLEREL